MALTIDNLLAKILYGETRYQKSLSEEGEKQTLFDYWNSHQSFKELLDEAARMGDKEEPSKVKKKSIDLFVLQSLIPRITYLFNLSEEDPSRKKLMKLMDKVPKAVKAAARNQEVAIQHEPVIESSPGFLERQWKKMTSLFHTSSDNIERFLDRFHPRTGEVNSIQEFAKDLLKVLLYIIELFADIIELLGLITGTEREQFHTRTYKDQFKLMIQIIGRTISKILKIIWNLPGGRLFFLITIVLFFNTIPGRFMLNIIKIGLQLVFKLLQFGFKLVGADEYITELSEQFQDLLQGVKDYMYDTARDIVIHLCKWIGRELGQDWVAELINKGLQPTQERIIETVQNGLTEATQRLTAVSAEQTGLVVAAIDQGTVETTRTILPEILKNRLYQAVSLGGAITASKAVGNILEGMQTAESIPGLKEQLYRVNSLLDDILVELKIDTLEQIQNSRELTPEQIDEIATTTVEKLQLSAADQGVITKTLNAFQQVLTNTGAQALMALPQIQQLIHPNRQRLLTNYGGKKTRRKHTKRNKTNKRNKNKNKKQNK